jgi:hypothetical protein
MMTNHFGVVEIGSTHYSLLACIGRATTCRTEFRKRRREGRKFTIAVLADGEKWIDPFPTTTKKA